jgi:hypothetical protein
MRFVLGMLAAAVITGAAFIQPAEARCFWNGFDTVCVHHRHFGFHPFGVYGPARPYGWGGY